MNHKAIDGSLEWRQQCPRSHEAFTACCYDVMHNFEPPQWGLALIAAEEHRPSRWIGFLLCQQLVPYIASTECSHDEPTLSFSRTKHRCLLPSDDRIALYRLPEVLGFWVQQRVDDAKGHQQKGLNTAAEHQLTPEIGYGGPSRCVSSE